MHIFVIRMVGEGKGGVLKMEMEFRAGLGTAQKKFKCGLSESEVLTRYTPSFLTHCHLDPGGQRLCVVHNRLTSSGLMPSSLLNGT